MLLENNPHLLCCTMIKAYFYLPQSDRLLRTTHNVVLGGSDPSSKVTGNFILSLILNHHFNYKLFPKLQGIECGWRDAYKSSRMKYNAYLKPQRFLAEKGERPLLPEITSMKKQKVSEYSAFHHY